jgi:uncharacterized protein (TIGR00661 family)
MARIFYGIQGDAGGHSSRALAVAELLRGHELLFAGGGMAERVSDAGYERVPLPVLGTRVHDGSLRIGATLRDFIRILGERAKVTRRLAEVIAAFDPHLILTDYEYFTPRAAFRLGRPCFSLDHQHVVARTLYPSLGQACSRRMLLTAMRVVLPGLRGCLISSFHQPPLAEPARDRIFGVLPRSDVLALRDLPGDHALVYLPDCDLGKIVTLFGGRRREYRIYGQGKRPGTGNLVFREPGRGHFLEDLASCAYVVCCGGHGLLTEALILHKPCLCFPRRLLYEQYWNSFFVGHNGYGRCLAGFAPPPGALDDFEASLDACKARIAARDFDGRRHLKACLETLLAG